MQRISKSRIPYLGIILCDVNDLKFINDTLGHQAGDTVLRVMADILRSVLRPDDVVARALAAMSLLLCCLMLTS